MNTQQYQYIGTSVHNGVCRLRFAQAFTEIAQMLATGHTNIAMHKLPEPMQETQARIYYIKGMSRGLKIAQD